MNRFRKSHKLVHMNLPNDIHNTIKKVAGETVDCTGRPSTLTSVVIDLLTIGMEQLKLGEMENQEGRVNRSYLPYQKYLKEHRERVVK